MEKKMKLLEEKQLKKDAKKKVETVLTEKSPECEIIKMEQPIESNVEEKTSSAKKMGNSLTDFFQKQPVTPSAQQDKGQPTILNFSSTLSSKKCVNGQKVDSA